MRHWFIDQIPMPRRRPERRRATHPRGRRDARNAPCVRACVALCATLLLLGPPLVAASAHTAGPSDAAGAESGGFVLAGVGFAHPTGLLYDPQADLYLVANNNGMPLSKDDNGFISRVSTAGEIIDLLWINGDDPAVTLHGPGGMAFQGDELLVADGQVVRRFERTTGTPRGFIILPGARSAIHLAPAPDGTVYASDHATNQIYRIEQGEARVALAGDQLHGPNGLAVTSERILFTTFNGKQIIARTAGEEDEVLWTLPHGRLYGLILLEDGSALTASWQTGALFRCAPSGEITIWRDGIAGPSAICHDPVHQRLLLLHYKDDKLEALPFEG